MPSDNKDPLGIAFAYNKLKPSRICCV